MGQIKLKKFLPHVQFVIGVFLLLMAIPPRLIYSEPLDYPVYIMAVERLLNGHSPYAFLNPEMHTSLLAFQYLPWSVWPFIPFALIPENLAWFLFLVVTTLSLGLSIYLLYKINGCHLGIGSLLLFTGLSIWMLQPVIIEGQPTALIILAIVGYLWLEKSQRPILAALLFPFVLIKIQFGVFFGLLLFFISTKKTRFYSFVILISFLVISTFLTPSWLKDMILMIGEVQSRDASIGHYLIYSSAWVLLGLNPRTGYAFSAVLMMVVFLIAWKIRYLHYIEWFSITSSLIVAALPYMHSYDLVLILPVMIFIGSKKSNWIWIISVVPLLFYYRAIIYLMILGLAIYALVLSKEILGEQNVREVSIDMG
jgi:hypothetical protein